MNGNKRDIERCTIRRFLIRKVEEPVAPLLHTWHGVAGAGVAPSLAARRPNDREPMKANLHSAGEICLSLLQHLIQLAEMTKSVKDMLLAGMVVSRPVREARAAYRAMYQLPNR